MLHPEKGRRPDNESYAMLTARESAFEQITQTGSTRGPQISARTTAAAKFFRRS